MSETQNPAERAGPQGPPSAGSRAQAHAAGRVAAGGLITPDPTGWPAAAANASSWLLQGATERACIAFDAANSDPQVQNVCLARGVGPALWIAIDTAQHLFGPHCNVHAEVDADPDTDEHRVVLDVTVDASVDERHRRYSEYTRAWVEAVGPDQREWVRVSLHPVRDS